MVDCEIEVLSYQCDCDGDFEVQNLQNQKQESRGGRSEIENSAGGVEGALINFLDISINMYSVGLPNEQAKILGDWEEIGGLYNSA